jgi:hypothetical protein
LVGSLKILLTLANLGNSIVEEDLECRWIELETAIKEYDQIILDLIASEITGRCDSVYSDCRYKKTSLYARKKERGF